MHSTLTKGLLGSPGSFPRKLNVGIKLLWVTAVGAGVCGDGVCTALKHFHLLFENFLYKYCIYITPAPLSPLKLHVPPCKFMLSYLIIVVVCIPTHMHINLPSPFNVVCVYTVQG